MQTQALAITGPGAVAARQLDGRELLDEFLRAADVSDATRRLYRFGLERFFSWLEGRRMAQPDRTAIVEFKADQLTAGLAPGSVNACLTALRVFFSWAEGERYYPNIAGSVKGCRRTPGHRRDAWTPAQITAALAAIPADSLIGQRDRAIINLLARTGCRTIELVRADVEDLRNKDGQTVLFVQGKGRAEKAEFVVLTEDALAPLRAYLQARGEAPLDAPLFCSESDRNLCSRLTTRTLRSIVKERFRAIGIDDPRLSAHSLRHFFATAALKGGADLLAVQQAMRHSSVTTTQIYLHGIDRMAGAAERFVQL